MTTLRRYCCSLPSCRFVEDTVFLSSPNWQQTVTNCFGSRFNDYISLFLSFYFSSPSAHSIQLYFDCAVNTKKPLKHKPVWKYLVSPQLCISYYLLLQGLFQCACIWELESRLYFIDYILHLNFIYPSCE